MSTQRISPRLQREKRGNHRRDIDAIVSEIVSRLADDKVLSEKNRDHGLYGEWSDHRECHLKPDLLLIYRKPDSGTLQLVRMGSHVNSSADEEVAEYRIWRVAAP